MLMSLEPVVLLAGVPDQVAYPAITAISGAIGGTVATMGRAIVVLYQNGRKDGLDYVATAKDTEHAISALTEAVKQNTAVTQQVFEWAKEDRYRRAANG